MMKGITAVVVGFSVALLAVAPAAAQESNEQLMKELEALKAKVEALESEKAPATSTPISVDGKGTSFFEDVGAVVESVVRDVKITGFIDVGVTFNLDRPNNGQNGNSGDPGSFAVPDVDTPAGISTRAFDNRSRSFMLHNAQLNLNRAATKENIVGYNIEISMGTDANVFDYATPTDDNFSIQEGYIQILADVGTGIDFKVGRFATLSGFEVIESINNWNYSRSLGFLFSIPFTHTGVRATYKPVNELSLSVGIVNGWDVINDNNDAKTLELQGAYTLMDGGVNLIGTIYSGAEKPATFSGRDPGDKRFLLDIVATVDLEKVAQLKGFVLGFNLDIGSEDNIVITDIETGIADTEDPEWMSWALYGKYTMDAHTFVVRLEALDDSEGYRTGIAGLDAGGHVVVAGKENSISSITLTYQNQLAKDLILRIEYRMDSSDEDIFLDGSSATDSQSTLGAELILSF